MERIQQRKRIDELAKDPSGLLVEIVDNKKKLYKAITNIWAVDLNLYVKTKQRYLSDLVKNCSDEPKEQLEKRAEIITIEMLSMYSYTLA